DEDRPIEVRRERKKLQHTADRERAVADPDLETAVPAGDSEPIRGDGAEHHDRVRRGRIVEEASGTRGAAKSPYERRIRCQDLDPAGVVLADQLVASHARVERLDSGDGLDLRQATDHPGRRARQLRLRAEERLSRLDAQEIRAE